MRKNISDLSRDELISIGMILDLPELVSFCKASKKINNILCKNNSFWRNKILKDHPNILPLLADISYNFKEIYEDMYLNKDIDVYSVKYTIDPLDIQGIVKGYIEEFIIVDNEYKDIPIGSKVYVLVSNRPDILFEYPIISNKREELEYMVIREILIQMENEDMGQDVIDNEITKYQKIVKENDLIQFLDYKFLIKELEII